MWIQKGKNLIWATIWAKWEAAGKIENIKKNYLNILF